jgi:hypothetical protein
MPKNVELGQRKIQKMPSMSEKHIEILKESAELAERKARETLILAARSHAPTNVIESAKDTTIITHSIAGSLGKPSDKWTGSPVNLANKLDIEDAKLDKKLEDFRVRNDQDIGKKIEGTGWLQMGYFTHILILCIVGVLVWFALRVFGMFNPVVGIGTKIVSGGAAAVSKLAGKGFSELIEGGERFKQKLDTEIDDPATREKIKNIFRDAHLEKQSRDVQDVVKGLTH